MKGWLQGLDYRACPTVKPVLVSTVRFGSGETKRYQTGENEGSSS